MFVSFFPQPKVFFLSALVWTLFAVLLWYTVGADFGAYFGLGPRPPGVPPIVGAAAFVSPPFLWFYIYYAAMVAIFAAVWTTIAPHRWANWSILGTSLIIFVTYFQVQVSVAVNVWYGPFYDLIQRALSRANLVTAGEFYANLLTFAGIAFVAVLVGVLNRFFVSHYIFRWRTAMNEYFTAHWPQLRHIEGASQRVQEDTMRFSMTMEDLFVSLVSSVMTLIAFLPILDRFSQSVTEVPLIGTIPHSLVVVAVAWSLFGTVLLGIVGIKLPGLYFRNQRVEAAYRKELVFGEDNADRAQPPTLSELFEQVRGNYFRLYFHYMYFNVARIFYLQADNIFGYIVLVPSLVTAKITLGLMNQVLNAFEQVRSSFQYLVNAWPTIIELLSIYKRLRAFEATLSGEELAPIEKEPHLEPAPARA